MIRIFRTLLLALLLLAGFHASAQKPVYLLDLFYQALSLTAEETLPNTEYGPELLLHDYTGEVISPAAIIARYPDAAKYLVDDSMFVIRGKFDVNGTVQDLNAMGDSRIVIENFRFEQDVLLNLKLQSTVADEVFYSSLLKVRHCVFNGLLALWYNNLVMQFEDNTIDQMAIADESVTSPSIRIWRNTIGLLQLWAINVREISITGNAIGQLSIYDIACTNLFVRNNRFAYRDGLYTKRPTMLARQELQEAMDVSALSADSLKLLMQQKDRTVFHIKGNDRAVNALFLSGNTFRSEGVSVPVILAQRSLTMELRDNDFEVPLILASNVSHRFVLEQNRFTAVNMGVAMPSTPQNYVSVDWPDLKGKLFYQRDMGDLPYHAQTDAELADQKRFFGLMGGYSRLLDVYKSYGNLDDANDVFLDMKALHLHRSEYMYRTHGGTTNFFKLNLGRLLSVYTRHGTDPAQAMTASLWIIIFFSVIYFFFPSDWDVSSKTKLLADFKTLTEKNKAGYVRPFFSLLKGFFYSFFNAITLSVNSFVTLGFGTIPTHGLAKYICIFQGFLGWFLLSIFIVALINQILI